ncbi:MAG: ATP-binding cassette domain-containing protein [Chitinophagaceae bacterium]|nr:ATP-binding cassette domain-containing protein [Chitinophagaceae bacterium]
MTEAISISGLTHRFGSRVILNDINFELKAGEIIGLFGRNGTGKSTLLNILYGSLKIQHGIIKINGDEQNKIFRSEGIYRMEKHKIGSLSMGEKKYLQFLMTVHLPQKFVLLDEPFAMIDPLYRDIIKDKIVELSATKGFILTDHYYRDVFDVANKRFLIKEAALKQITSITDLKNEGYISGA